MEIKNRMEEDNDGGLRKNGVGIDEMHVLAPTSFSCAKFRQLMIQKKVQGKIQESRGSVRDA